MLKSIFYARFHQAKGPTVLHQVPEGSVIPCPPSPTAQTPLFKFNTISDYIIPRREFCNRLLVVCCNRYRIIGFPVCITDDVKYDRNDFIFNFCLVLDESAQWSAYASVVRKLARLFRNLEEQGAFLSLEEQRGDLIIAGQEGYGGRAKVYALCEMIMEDLNNYCECMIPLDESNTLNLKLFPTRPPPAPIHAWHVPLSIVRFASLQTQAWDLTVQRIIPHIDGVHSVAAIAALADTDISLTRRAIANLVYYGCILLLDIFSFSAVYAPTAELGVFINDQAMQDECRRYVASPLSPFDKDAEKMQTLLATLSPQKASPSPASPPPPSRSQIVDLYVLLRHGQSLRDWCLAHSSRLGNVDVRRFITFGIIKGFLYRVHKYALALRPADLDVDLDDPIANAKAHDRAWRKAAMSSGWRTPRDENDRKMDWLSDHGGGDVERTGAGAEPQKRMGAPDKAQQKLAKDAELRGHTLARYLDGMHCLDEVCTELKLTERDAVTQLKDLRDVVFVQR